MFLLTATAPLVAVIIFFDGSNAAAWKSHLSDLNDLAGDLFDEASLIAVDTRFFPDVLKTHKVTCCCVVVVVAAGRVGRRADFIHPSQATRAGQACVYRGDSQPILYEDNDAASIKATVHKLLGKK